MATVQNVLDNIDFKAAPIGNVNSHESATNGLYYANKDKLIFVEGELVDCVELYNGEYAIHFYDDIDDISWTTDTTADIGRVTVYTEEYSIN